MPTPLDYSTPTPPVRRLNLAVAAIGGIVAGPATFGSAFVVGPLLYLGVGLITGVVLSSVAAACSPGREFLAGIVASGFAAIAAVAAIMLYGPMLGPVRIAGVLVLWWVLFAVPGLLGSLWAWERRQHRQPPIE